MSDMKAKYLHERAHLLTGHNLRSVIHQLSTTTYRPHTTDRKLAAVYTVAIAIYIRIRKVTIICVR